MRALIAAVLFMVGASCSDSGKSTTTEPTPPRGVTLDSLQEGMVLPGTTLLLSGSSFLDDASYSGALDGAVLFPVEVDYVDSGTLAVTFPAEGFDQLGEGTFTGTLQIEARGGPNVSGGEVSVALDVRQTLAPSVSQVARGVFPASPVSVRGAGFIADGEGTSVVELRGTFTADDGGPAQDIQVDGVSAARPEGQANWGRDSIRFVFFPDWAGIRPGQVQGELRVVNQGQGWQRAGDWVPISFDLLPPTIESLSTASASRGEAVRIAGQGFLGGTVGGLTVLRLRGVFTPRGGAPVELGPSGLEIAPNWRSGNELVFAMRVRYDFDCQSGDLGATPGMLEGTVTPEIEWQGQTVEGAPYPLTFEIRPTKQVVFLRFLPAFTDSLRLFGLRNVSGEVKDRILAVVRRDYSGINLEVRLEEPTDFLDYSIVEVGGPDPNSQQLFGLDNTTGLDRCNQRLDDLLAGINADSDSYGGVFVESFLQLSPKRGTENPLANEMFDQIFDPVIANPVEPGEYPGGARDAEVDQAIDTLGNLVGNTLTHEIGHSLGLPVDPGCGQYHNAPGDRQIMDCGADRPFEERAGISAPAVWTDRNRQYLEEILPL